MASEGTSIGRAILSIGGDPGDLNKVVSGVKKKVGVNLAKTAKKTGVAMTVMGGAVVAALGTAAKAAADFTTSLGEINTLGVQNVAALGDGIKDVAATFGQELGPTAKATYDIISAGVPEGNALDVLAVSAQAAVAGVTDVGTAVDLGTSVLNAFGLQASDTGMVFDVAFTAVKDGKTTITELAAAVGQAAPVFAATGQSMEELFAATSTLTAGGIKTAEAYTSLRALVDSIKQPTGAAAAMFKKLGIESGIAALESKGLSGVLADIKEKTGGNVEQIQQLITSSEAQKAAFALLGKQGARYASTLKNMETAQGASKRAFDLFIAANPAFAFKQLAAEAKVLSVEIGEALLPGLIELSGMIIPMLKSVRKWIKDNPKLTSTIVKWTAALAAVAVVLGPILIALPSIVAGIKLVAAAVTAIIAIISSPLILAIGAAVGAVAFAVVSIRDEWGNIKKMIFDAWDWIVAQFRFGANLIKDVFDTIVGWARDAIDWALRAIGLGNRVPGGGGRLPSPSPRVGIGGGGRGGGGGNFPNPTGGQGFASPGGGSGGGGGPTVVINSLSVGTPDDIPQIRRALGQAVSSALLSSGHNPAMTTA